MLEIKLVRYTKQKKLQVMYRLNGVNHARFFKNFEALDEFKEQYKEEE